MSELMLQATIAASGIGLIAGMLGCFVLWRRMSYMGDAMGHASLLGVVLGLLLGILPPLAVVMVAVLVGFALSRLEQDRRLPFDALLGVVSTGGLALGLVLYGLMPTRQIDLYGYLFGDVLAVSSRQMVAIYLALPVQGALVAWQWRNLLRAIFHAEVARVEGVPVARLQAMMTVLIAVTVALALQVVGMLLITAMLVVPPLAARALSSGPKQMVLLSMGFGVASAIAGVWLSYLYNLSTGPSIVLSAVALFGLSLSAGKAFGRLN